VRDKKQAIKSLAAQASKLCELSEREIFNVLMERENLGCTGVGNGVCIPHGRFEGLKEVHALFAHLEKPIAFGAADGKPIDLIMLLLTPVSANTEHIKALATISRLLRDKVLCDRLRKTYDGKVTHSMLVATPGSNDDVALSS
jgi:PTS system nitrogen regulatory IIA component